MVRSRWSWPAQLIDMCELTEPVTVSDAVCLCRRASQPPCTFRCHLLRRSQIPLLRLEKMLELQEPKREQMLSTASSAVSLRRPIMSAEECLQWPADPSRLGGRTSAERQQDTRTWTVLLHVLGTEVHFDIRLCFASAQNRKEEIINQISQYCFQLELSQDYVFPYDMTQPQVLADANR